MAGILGFGRYLPERVMTNAEWAELVDTSDEWIVQRTGINTRRFAHPDQTTVDLAAEAAKKAMQDAGLGPDDLDEVILATDTREVATPDTAAFLQERLGLREVPAYDLGGSGCAGFIQGLDIARARIALDPKRVLVVGVELITKLIDMRARETAVLFGDGAGAVVVGPGGTGRAEIVDALTGTDGSRADILTLEVGGTRAPFNEQALASGAHKYLHMDGRLVFTEAVRRMSASILTLLERLGRTPDELALVIPHQANLRIIEAIRRRLEIGRDKVYVNVDRYGNTGSATVPIALSEAVSDGTIREGDLVILVAFGAGFHWGGAALQF